MRKQNKLSLTSRGLKSKLNVVFYLMSVVPILVCIYIVSNYIFPQMGLKLDITVFILMSSFIALFGFYVIKEIIDRILSVSADAKLIAAGAIERKVEEWPKDEVGDLGEALNQLARRINELEIKDPLTGLYNETFIRGRLEEEIRRAIVYRRPCAFILLNIDNFQRFRELFGLSQAKDILKRIASLIRDSFTEVERVARIGDDEFAVILPERNKRQAKEIADETRRKIELAFAKESDADKRLTVSGGVSENPLDGVNAEQLIIKAKEALNSAKAEGKNRIGILSFKLGCP